MKIANYEMGIIPTKHKRQSDINGHDRIRMLFIYIFLAIITAIVTVYGVWVLYPYQTIQLSDSPFKIVGPTTVSAGEYVTYEVSYIKYTTVIPTQYKQFVDGIVFQISPEMSKPVILEPGSGKARIAIRIPETLPSGVYNIHTDTYYQMNPVRTIHEESFTEKFTVINKDKL